MDKQLSDIYSAQVKPKGDVSISSSGMFGAIYERDPYFSNLELNIFSKLENLIKDNEQKPSLPDYKKNNMVKFSLEDAIRELKELGEI
jgi:hypothetical protein